MLPFTRDKEGYQVEVDYFSGYDIIEAYEKYYDSVVEFIPENLSLRSDISKMLFLFKDNNFKKYIGSRL